MYDMVNREHHGLVVKVSYFHAGGHGFNSRSRQATQYNTLGQGMNP